LVEVLQADGWADWTSAPSALIDLYRVTCDARRCEPLPIGESMPVSFWADAARPGRARPGVTGAVSP